MALTGDRYLGNFKGHTVELIRNNWVKSLSLWIDGNRVALTMHIWPWPTTLTGTLEHDGVAHAVVARCVSRHLFRTTDTVEVDGETLSLTKKY